MLIYAAQFKVNVKKSKKKNPKTKQIKIGITTHFICILNPCLLIRPSLKQMSPTHNKKIQVGFAVQVNSSKINWLTSN